MKWDQLTYKKLAALDRRIPLVLCVTATEQHGPHLPLATDRLIAEHFCFQLDEAIPDKVLILPTLAVGCSRHHMDFAGSLTLRHETFIEYIVEVANSALAHGFTRLILFNSHGGNLASAQVAMERIGLAHPECRVVLATWWRIAAEELLKLNDGGPGSVGHACEFETSLVMHIAPELVDTAAIRPGRNPCEFEWGRGDLLRSPRANYFRTMQQQTADGTFGDPTRASASKGQAIANAVVQALERIVSDLYSAPE